jgi:hypothetical protein
MGYPWIYEQKDILTKLLLGESIPVSNSIFADRLVDSHEKEWNYIHTSSDIDVLLEQTSGFHDSVITTIK